MRAVYLAIVLGFFRRLLRKMLVSPGRRREYVEGNFLVVVVRREYFYQEERYWVHGFGGRWQVDKLRRELRETWNGKFPEFWSVDVVPKPESFRTMKYWSMIPNGAASDAASDVALWWDANRGRYM